VLCESLLSTFPSQPGSNLSWRKHAKLLDVGLKFETPQRNKHCSPAALSLLCVWAFPLVGISRIDKALPSLNKREALSWARPEYQPIREPVTRSRIVWTGHRAADTCRYFSPKKNMSSFFS
jgi:hypothetical protein